MTFAADWPPVLNPNPATLRTLDGRTIERYTHGPREAWGYPADDRTQWTYPTAQETGVAAQTHHGFYVIPPREPRPAAPLCVVLHSANRTAYDQLALQHLAHGDTSVATWAPDDFYALYLNTTNREWWGASDARRNKSTDPAAMLSPAERRVLDTIQWVVTQYKIDRNRIYLTGLSMGGCGTLALGMPHGEIFAAIRAQVPAGTEYVAKHMGGFPAAPAADAPQAARDAWTKCISAAGLPDPPIVVDFSAQNDNWSKTQPPLLQAARGGHLPLVLGWGMFHHTTYTSPIAKFPLCNVALAFPWLEIRKNEAYPVFTNASSDQHSPWLGDPAHCDESGQTNAYFRWKNQTDTPSSFAMQLWLAHPTVGNPPPTMPDTSTADITLRRLQHFEVRPGGTYAWRLLRGGKPAGSGSITPDAANRLTIPNVTVTTAAAELTVAPQNR